jgi:hypothetical protein
MGLEKIISKMLMEIGLRNGPMDTHEQKKKFMERVNPQQAKGGFLRVEAVVCCPCGVPVPIDASPPVTTEAEFDEIDEQPGVETIKLKTPDCPHDAPTKVATNIGITEIKCSECDRQYIVAWEFDACNIRNDIPLPWDDTDGPDHPSSEPSFSERRPKSQTVH